jgi:hypothetical protein
LKQLLFEAVGMAEFGFGTDGRLEMTSHYGRDAILPPKMKQIRPHRFDSIFATAWYVINDHETN